MPRWRLGSPHTKIMLTKLDNKLYHGSIEVTHISLNSLLQCQYSSMSIPVRYQVVRGSSRDQSCDADARLDPYVSTNLGQRKISQTTTVFPKFSNLVAHHHLDRSFTCEPAFPVSSWKPAGEAILGEAVIRPHDRPRLQHLQHLFQQRRTVGCS